MTLPEGWKKVIVKGVRRGIYLSVKMVIRNCPTFEARGVALGSPWERGPEEFEIVFTRSPFKYTCLKGDCDPCWSGPVEECDPIPTPYRTLMLVVNGYVKFRVEVIIGG